MNDASPPRSTNPNEAPSNNAEKDIAEFAQSLKTSKESIANLLRPLPEDANARIEARVLGLSEDDSKKARVIPIRSRTTWIGRIGFAAAAAIVLAFGATWWTRQQPAPIAYQLEMKGDSAVRGDKPPTDEPVHLGPSTPLEIKLRPQTPTRDMALRVFVVRGEKAQLLSPTHSNAADGTMSIRGPAREVLGDQPDGPAEMVFLIGAALPDDETAKGIAINPTGETPKGTTQLRRALILEGWGSTLRSIQRQDVEFAGCEAVVAGPVCEVGEESTLRFWVPSRDKGLVIHLNGQVAESKRITIQDGTRLSVTVPRGTKEVAVTGPSGETFFRLPLRPSLDTPALREAMQAMRKNNLALAEEKLDVAKKDAQRDVILQALRIQARIERRKQSSNTKDLFQKAIDLGHAAGRISDELDDRYLLGFVRMIGDYDFAGAKSDLAWGAALDDQCPERRIDGDYYRGLLAMEMGRLDEALRWFRRSSAGAERLDLPEQDRAARLLMSDILGILGRHSEAHQLLERVLEGSSASEDPCIRARFATTAAWVRMRAVEASEDNAAALSQATEAANLAKTQCPSAHALALLNLAFLDARTKKITEARNHLAEARQAAAPDDQRFRVWSDFLAMELDVLEKPADVLSASEALQAKGTATLSPELSFAAFLNRARALDALGRQDDAQAAFEEANEALDRWSALVPLGEGLETFFLQNENSARHWMDFLVRQAEAKVPGTLTWTNSATVAAAAARRSLVRFFATLAQTDLAPPGDASSYRKSRKAVDAAVTNKKPAPENDVARLEKAQKDARAALVFPQRSGMNSSAPANSLTLLYHPLVYGWVGFALESNGQVHIARLPPFDEEALTAVEKGSHSAALSKILLEPFAEPIRRAKRLRVPAHGRLRRIPFEALPWEGRVLADSVAVTYGFDGAGVIDRDVDPSLKCTTQPGALVVTNPGGDLPGAKKASMQVQNALRSHGWSVHVLEGVAATRENALAQLQDPCTTLFHYDGHAKFDGRDGLRAVLVLHDGTLTVTDILELPRVPQSVALLGCATGKDEGLGLAQAFLVRGSHEVLAAMEDVDDRLSQRLAEGLYINALAATHGPPSLTSALQVSSAALRSTADKNDAWWLFRVFSR